MATQEPPQILACAVRMKVVVKYLRQLMLPLAAIDLLPAVVALGYGDSELAVRFQIVAVGTYAAGLLFPHCLLICTCLFQAQVRVFI